jgi:branched-chain amino acid transport system ATP-binding protein
MTIAVELRGITKRHGAAVAVDGVDLVVERGRITMIVGPNGAGKTSLFDCISGVDPADAGTVLHGGRDVTGWTCDRLARTGLVRTFQHSSIFATLTVADNLLVAAENRRRGGVVRGLLGVPDRRDDRASIVAHVLADLGLTGVADIRAGALPSGTKRMVELGRALCSEPDTLLLDEPASGLDDGETDRLHDVLGNLAEQGLALLMIEHDLGLVKESADTVHVMQAGRIVASGPPADVLNRSGLPFVDRAERVTGDGR